MGKTDNEQCYLLEYEYGDKKWGSEIYAFSREEAEQKLEALKKTATIIGVLVERIPVWDVHLENRNN